ncbi:hypothetical protein Y032_0043g747 [Ancylostoma ceylanicum]|uniref:Uncharacterized protein n=1 Tax=Ancylostoma ceylanicum TaxID=53326 RepID=A0A016UDU5_9BILA|nr:hypothetical protein Y032_0043g747 [Ancylostoma ceylanicum]
MPKFGHWLRSPTTTPNPLHATVVYMWIVTIAIALAFVAYGVFCDRGESVSTGQFEYDWKQQQIWPEASLDRRRGSCSSLRNRVNNT